MLRVQEEEREVVRERLFSGLRNNPASSDQPSSSVLNDFSQRLKAEWDKIPSNLFPLLRKGEEVALCEVEEAYAESLMQAEVALAQMTRRIGDGRFIVNFPQRIARLLTSVLSHFNAQVAGNALVRQRIERTKTLRAFVLSNAERLFQLLLQIQEIEHTNQFNREIVNTFKKFGLEGSSGEEEEGNEEETKKKKTKKTPLSEALKQLVRRKSFDFASSVKQIEDASLGFLVPDSMIKDFSEKLENAAAAFPESPEAKLLELKKMEKQVARPPRRGRKKRTFGGIGFSLSLVGMLRPPGYGNLQGFIGYGRPFFGVPVDFLLGIQNDGDSMEVSSLSIAFFLFMFFLFF